MKSIIVVVLLAGCFASKKSSDYECSQQSDCVAGRVCTQGYCIEGNVPIDGTRIDANRCPTECSSCDTTAMTCTINCTTPGGCASPVTCPPGYACDITCTKGSSCKGIDCTDAKSCSIACTVANACTNTIACGAGKCDVQCNGMSSCPSVNCASSCACDVTCANGDCGTLMCPTATGGPCTTDRNTGTDCSSTVATECSTCI